MTGPCNNSTNTNTSSPTILRRGATGERLEKPACQGRQVKASANVERLGRMKVRLGVEVGALRMVRGKAVAVVARLEGGCESECTSIDLHHNGMNGE